MKKLIYLLVRFVIPVYILFNLYGFLYDFTSLSVPVSSIRPTIKQIHREEETDRGLRGFDPLQNRIAFFHMQKTSGTNFDLLITRNILLFDRQSRSWRPGCVLKVNQHRSNRPRIINATNRYSCKAGLNSNQAWYLGDSSEFGYQCGLHSYLSEFKTCVSQRYSNRRIKVHFFTILREPVERYISEYLHTLKYFRKQKNAWIFKPAKSQEQICINRKIWSCQYFWRGLNDDFNITSFMACNESLGVNRMTRMLAQYNDREFNLCDTLPPSPINETRLLESAKSSLVSFKFFGLTEMQQDTMKLMEAVFDGGLKFNLERVGKVQKTSRSTLKFASKLDKDIIEEIRRLNHLDIQLYSFAKELFNKRLSMMTGLDELNRN